MKAAAVKAAGVKSESLSVEASDVYSQPPGD